MILKITIDETCSSCADGLAEFKKLSARNEQAYGSYNKKTGDRIDGLQLIPDYNAFGVMTHWHLK